VPRLKDDEGSGRAPRNKSARASSSLFVIPLAGARRLIRSVGLEAFFPSGGMVPPVQPARRDIGRANNEDGSLT